MPTQHERLFHGIGSGDDLAVVDTPLGRVGGLICWENRMPLARHQLYREERRSGWRPRPTTPTSGSPRCATSRSSRARTWSRCRSTSRGGVPHRLPGTLGDDPDKIFGRGGAAIVEPTWGGVIAGPLYGEEGMVLAECDLREGLHAKRWFDSVGHYSREDVLGVAPPPSPASAGTATAFPPPSPSPRVITVTLVTVPGNAEFGRGLS